MRDPRIVVARLSPHLNRALNLRQTLEAQRAQSGLLRETLDLLAQPVLIADASARLVHANRRGEAALRSSAHLTLSHGRIAARNPADRDWLRALSDALGRGAGGGAARRAGPGGTAWPLAAPLSEHRAACLGLPQCRRLELIALRTGSGASCPDAATLRTLFDLSPAEAELAAALAHGRTLAEFACVREVTRNTANSQLKSLFAKTGASRQSELVRLLAGLAPLAMPGKGK
ncbi:hypothetical protein [Mangrovicoccus sp. HB161399]|uniref:helix-turn-helix transcriptional regulator n=1 Tax=Mangrovicoccus sp. HB161399 TaxID=2720392 RepID=UPI001555C7BC|nr:hypothetical protein [Mangrovicoccus sp. HB161399]